ncbi:hypothetical protein F4775DRAFT_415942 [Biscogniauxia sp. FL1348]|nr:hypothetical protein F4775DRAFT_415942 [Biscogniauxia sp. FL1348]
MATSREERMQQRMRGAGRHEVAADSFDFVIPGAEPEPEPETSPSEAPTRSEPNTSAKRRRLSPDSGFPVPNPHSSVARAFARLDVSKSDPYDALEDEVLDDAPDIPPTTSPADIVLEDAPEPQPATSSAVKVQPFRQSALQSPPSVGQRPTSRSSIVGPMIEEVTESPAAAPGSGHRRRIKMTDTTTRSAKLQKAVLEEENGFTAEFTTSSPLARKTRMSGATPSALSARSTRSGARQIRESPIEEVVESSPIARRSLKGDSSPINSSARSTRSQNRPIASSSVAEQEDELASPTLEAPITRNIRKPKPKAKKPEPEPEPEPEVEPELEPEPEPEPEPPATGQELRDEVNDEEVEEAEEVDVHEAARRIGRKRHRVSPPREESPELHSQLVERKQPATKRQRKRPSDTPAKQSHPKPRKEKTRPTTRKRKSNGEAIPITVQRYTKRTIHNEDDTDEDILNADIPFANRSGVNVIDVLSQICDEVIEASLESVHESAINAKDAGVKKEFRTKLRALEAFQEELRTRLLEHTIALDTMHALKKRVRSVQKEKLALRTEILRIRAEREQVGLKMDAVRARHETANEEILHQLGLSSVMDDIELAIENGKSAPDLNPKEQKVAELANLELLISQVAGQASDVGDGGGNLKQIKDFNAFLERAAAALEGR